MCVDLIFTSQPNLVAESEVHLSLHSNFHHQIVFAKFNLMISYSPPYSKEDWHYREANTDLVRTATSNLNWEKVYNTNVTNKVSIFNETILTVPSNYISHETLTCDDKDSQWFKSRIKSLWQDKNKLYKDFRRSNTNAQLLNKLNHLQERLNILINKSKQNYYVRISNNLRMSAKTVRLIGPCKGVFWTTKDTSDSTFVSWK